MITTRRSLSVLVALALTAGLTAGAAGIASASVTPLATSPSRVKPPVRGKTPAKPPATSTPAPGSTSPSDSATTGGTVFN